MKLIDRWLQSWRERKVRAWLRPGARVLDVGCHQGEFLERLGSSIRESIGLDPLARPREAAAFTLQAVPFAEPLDFPAGRFDAITLLATLEHIRDKAPLAREARRLLSPGGRLIMTVPSPRVDDIVHTLVRLGLADGMSLEEHHGFKPEDTGPIFTAAGLALEHHSSFQLGLNHLFVFRRPENEGARIK
ncbi:MAG: Class SAM-dependent methyltransferase [Verrucomicrobiota bacterium]|nr:Class SAM-dependent methyltransferase [Verrucomicrobiota bacterium]